MNESIARTVAQRGPNDQPLTEAARVALEADQTPRVIKMTVDQDGQPIEKPQTQPTVQPLPE